MKHWIIDARPLDEVKSLYELRDEEGLSLYYVSKGGLDSFTFLKVYLLIHFSTHPFRATIYRKNPDVLRNFYGIDVLGVQR